MKRILEKMEWNFIGVEPIENAANGDFYTNEKGTYVWDGTEWNEFKHDEIKMDASKITVDGMPLLLWIDGELYGIREDIKELYKLLEAKTS